MEPPKRRWSFSLRTLFVAVALASIPFGWIAWEVHRAAYRRAVMEQFESAGGHEMTFTGEPKPYTRGWVSMWVANMLGDFDRYLIGLPATMPADEIARVEQAFPEALIVTVDQDGNTSRVPSSWPTD